MMELPIAFTGRMQELLQEEYQDFLESYNRKRNYGLRVNTYKIKKEEFVEAAPFSMREIPWTDHGFFYEEEEQPARHPYYYSGLYYLQEPSAMLPAELLPVEPGDLVLDLCAAPGGKATELGAKLKGRGILFANDLSSTRAKALLKNIELFGLPNAVVLTMDGDKLAERFPAYFDKILIDAPCSGEGMFRKDPGLIRSWQEKGPDYYSKIQKELIVKAAIMLKPGGMMLYSTCTFAPEENEAVIQYLLEQMPDMHLLPVAGVEGGSGGRPEWVPKGRKELVHAVRVWPHKSEGEGHFAALLQKEDCSVVQNVDPAGRKGTEQKNPKNPKIPSEASEFLEQLTKPLSGGTFEQIGDKLLYLPEGMPDRKGLRILRSGLYLGDCKRKRFEPSQALAMSLPAADFASCIVLPAEDDRVIRYLKGETLDVSDLTAAGQKGWQLVCIGMGAGNGSGNDMQAYPMGWGKLAGGMLKNKYFAGWRWNG